MMGEGNNSTAAKSANRPNSELKIVVTNPMHIIELPGSRRRTSWMPTWSCPTWCSKGCNVARCLSEDQRQKILHLWQIFVVLTVMISSVCVGFMWSSPTPGFTTVSLTSPWSLIAYAGDAVYITDMAVKFCTGSYNNHLFVAIVDMFTILPFELMALIPSLRLMSIAVLRSNRVGRLHIVLDYFNTLQSWMNVTRMLACKYLTLASLYIHLMACASCAMTDFGQQDMNIDLLHYVTAVTTTVAGYKNIVPAASDLEKWFSVLSMIMGVVVFYGVILSGIASRKVNMDMERSRYVHYIVRIKEKLRASQTPSEVADDVINYHQYVVCYRNEEAYQTLLSKLPITFRADIAHSAYGHILKEAFPNRSARRIGFVRMLALEMTRNFYVPGQTILRQNDRVDTMRYLMDGEVLAEDMEDDTKSMEYVTNETPELDCGKKSFISMYAWTSHEELRARTYCDIVQLSAECYDSFKYPRVDVISTASQTADMGPRGEEKAWYPEGHAPIATCSEVTLSEYPKPYEPKPQDPDADSWVYPPPNKEDWTTEDYIIWCIGSCLGHGIAALRTVLDFKFDGYFMPKSKLAICWDWLVVMLTILIAFMYPFAAVFLGDINIGFRDEIFITMCVFDVVIIFDFVLTLRIKHMTPTGTTQGLKSNLKYYIKTPACLLDVTAMIMLYPVSFAFTTGFAVDSGLIYWLSLNRLIKLWKVHHFFTRKEQNLMCVLIVKALLYVALFAHWCACLWYLGHPNHGLDGFDNLTDKDSILIKYLVALYQSVSTMTGTQTYNGYGDTTAHSLYENILVIFVRIGGFILFGYILSCAVSILTNKNKIRQIRPIQDFPCPIEDKPAACGAADSDPLNTDENKNQCQHASEKVKIVFCLSIFFSALTLVWLFQACPIQGLTEYGDYCHNNSWALRLNGDFGNKLTNTQKFIRSFYWAASTGAMAGNGYVSTDNVAEMVTAISSMLLGMFTFIYVVASVTATKTTTSFKLACQRALFRSVTAYLKDHNVAGHLQHTILKYLSYPEKCTMAVMSDSPSCSTLTSVSSLSPSQFTTPAASAPKGDVIIQMELEEEQPSSSQAANRMVIDPRSVHWRIFSCIICVLTIVTSIIVSLQACYQYECLWLLIVSYVCEIVFVIEIIAKFHLSQIDKYGDQVTDFGNIRGRYFKSLGGFALDMIPTIPLEIVAMVIPVDYGYFTLFTYLRLTRLIRLVKVQRYFSCLEKQLNVNLLTVCVTKVFVYLMLIIHFFAYTWHAIIASSSEYPSNDSESLFQRYTDSVYMSVSLLTATVGQAHTDKEMLFAGFTLIVGQLLVACIVLGNIISTLANRDAQRVQYETDRKHFKEYMITDKVDDGIQQNIIEYLDWQYNKCGDQLSQFLPDYVRKELTMHMFGEYLKKVPLLAGCTKEFLEEISLHLKEVVLRAGDDIVKQGDMSQELNVIYKGQAVVVSKNDPDSVERVLKEGNYIDDCNILNSTPSKNKLKALTQVNIITLSLTDLQETMAKYRLNAMLVKQNSRSLSKTSQPDTCAAATTKSAATSCY